MSTVKSADRTMMVLEFLSTRARPVPTMAIAKHCGLPRSSTYHLLNAMGRQRFVQYYADDHAWGLGAGAFAIASGYNRSESVSWLARSTVRQLAEDLSATAHLGLLDGGDVVYFLKENPGERLDGLVSRVGTRLPAHLTAVGRAILMALPVRELRALYPVGQTLAIRTGRGPTLVIELERELEAQRAAGYAIERGLTSHGVTCIGATVYTHEGRAVAGVGISLAGQPQNVERLARHVTAAAAEISAKLGYRPRADEPLAEAPMSALSA